MFNAVFLNFLLNSQIMSFEKSYDNCHVLNNYHMKDIQH